MHAGFIPGVKILQQNQLLMMKMRSDLRYLTVTAITELDRKWATLWRCQQTVVFPLPAAA